MPLFRDEATDPGYSAGVTNGVAIGAMTGGNGARTDAMTGATGEMTAATGVPDPDCFADSSKTRSVWMGLALSASILSTIA